MEIKKDYTVLFNAISDVTELLEECVQILKNAQKTTEEMHIGEDENEL